jgi:predicted MFS family arabinose efflux permease
MITLLMEAYNPPWIPDLTVHLVCRLCQGFIGAFLFFYSFLLAVKLFDGAQQVFALTSASIALNVAEVFGPAVGASIFTAFGPAAPYLFLGILSVLNNLLLWIVLVRLPTGDEYDMSVAFDDTERSFSERCDTLKRVVTEPLLWRAVLVIGPAAGVKSCFESVLPFFGYQHDYSEMRVGFLFMVVAVAYITASVSIGYTWLRIRPAQQTVLIFLALGGLGAAAAGVLSAYKINWHMDKFGLADFTRHEAFYVFLFTYGVFLGLTHTPASYLLGNAIDKFGDASAQDAVNGIFNTCWELGGSIGFLCSGLASRHSWHEEQAVLGCCASAVGVGALLFVASSETFNGAIDHFRSPETQKLLP